MKEFFHLSESTSRHYAIETILTDKSCVLQYKSSPAVQYDHPLSIIKTKSGTIALRNRCTWRSPPYNSNLQLQSPDENAQLSPSIQYNSSKDNNSRTNVTVSFRDITAMKPCPGLSLNQLALRFAYGTETADP
ncbi:hypothetical protein TNCV_3821301 [Trichonephila clavipes]|nr:hypothetical protein TNCV_3821301 [Trichonephila clavipes]